MEDVTLATAEARTDSTTEPKSLSAWKKEHCCTRAGEIGLYKNISSISSAEQSAIGFDHIWMLCRGSLSKSCQTLCTSAKRKIKQALLIHSSPLFMLFAFGTSRNNVLNHSSNIIMWLAFGISQYVTTVHAKRCISPGEKDRGFTWYTTQLRRFYAILRSCFARFCTG